MDTPNDLAKKDYIYCLEKVFELADYILEDVWPRIVACAEDEKSNFLKAVFGNRVPIQYWSYNFFLNIYN